MSPFRSSIPVAIARRMYSQNSQQPSQSAGRATLKYISNVLNDVIETQPASQPFTRSHPATSFPSNTFLRPIQLNRQFRSKQAIRRKRPLLGPGRGARQDDVFLQFSIDPRVECDNSVLMSNFVTSMGKIRTRAETGLTTKSQRLLTKAIKRAKMMGVIPTLSRRVL